jgi:hypothetical protein
VVSVLLAAAADDPGRNGKGLLIGLLVSVAVIAVIRGWSNRNGR